MRIDFHNLVFETPHVTFYLFTPWRATALEHRLFEAVRQAIHTTPEESADDRKMHVHEPKVWRAAQQAMLRVLKGWQEEAEQGRERRAFRWLLEGDCDPHGYDAFGEPLSLWIYLRLGVERGGPDDPPRGEDIDLEGFGVRIWSERGT